jgi:5-methylcytosine-specific restriction endonuclease McrA
VNKYKVWAKTDGKCWYCGKSLKVLDEASKTDADFKDEFCTDHVLASTRGGAGTLDNIVPCCRHCNSEKRTKTVEEYRDWLDRRSPTFFTEAQVSFLEKHGIHLPPRPKHVFWFERR